MAEFLPEGLPVSESVSSFISVGSRDSTSTDRKFVQFPGTPYPTLDEGAFLNFATIATNGGHDGNFDPTPFILPAGIESLTDFAHRAVRLSVKIGKQIASGHYGAAPHRSYYSGCSAGGRQGIAVASSTPRTLTALSPGFPPLIEIISLAPLFLRRRQHIQHYSTASLEHDHYTGNSPTR